FLLPFQRNTGPNLSPFNACVLLKGLETIDLRMSQQSTKALKVDQLLESWLLLILHLWLHSPPQQALAKKQMDDCGSIYSMWLDGGREQAHAVLNALELIDISNNIGDSRSLMCHNATTTHHNMGAEGRAEMGVSEGMLRINVGLEHPDDLIEDLDQAL